jgi:hypothetical protein
MQKRSNRWRDSVSEQAAVALVRAVVCFLGEQELGARHIQDVIVQASRPLHGGRGRRSNEYVEFIKTYEEMGILLSTWYTNSEFLDKEGNLLALAPRSRGRRSIGSLIKASGTSLQLETAISFLRISPSIRVDSKGWFVAIKRAFVLESFEIPRAALIVERFLETLRRNEMGRSKEIPILLERSCYVTGVDKRKVPPLLRDIRSKGVAFMDSVDGEIEAHRLVRAPKAATGEMGVVTFAWTRDKTASRKRR